MVLTMSLSIFVQSVWSYLACLAIYGIKVAGEHTFGIRSPLSRALLGIYLLLTVLAVKGVDFQGYTGIIIFSVLLAVVACLHMAGRPFSTFYSAGHGSESVHKAISWIWVTAYASALLATVSLMPHWTFVVVPTAICLLAMSATLFASFIWCGVANQRLRTFRTGDLAFHEITSKHADFAEFCSFYARNLMTDPRQAASCKTLAELIAGIRETEISAGNSTIIFVCKLNGVIIGCIRCVVDRRDSHLPTEKEIDCSFDDLRKYGKLMEVGRLAIDEAHRGKPEVLTGLFSGVVNVALERDVSYLVSSGFPYIVSVYLKLGFVMLFGKSDRRHAVRRSHGYVTHPVLLDFSDLVLNKTRKGNLKFGMYELASPYLAERWFKRALVKRFLARCTMKSFPRDLKEIRKVLEHDKPLAGGSMRMGLPEIQLTANGEQP